MARYTDPSQLLAKQKSLTPKIIAKAKKIHENGVRNIEKEVRQKLLSGPLTPLDERRMGHPYARIRLSRRGYQRERLKGGKVLSTKLDRKGVWYKHRGAGISVGLLPINHQSGKLADSAAILRLPVAAPSSQEFILAYRAPYAKYVLGPKGTRLMRARGFQVEKAKIDRRVKRETEYAIRYMTLSAAATGHA